MYVTWVRPHGQPGEPRFRQGHYRVFREPGDPPVIRLPNGVRTVPYAIKCNIPGCRRRKRGYLTIASSHLGGGAFYDRKGTLLADLRERVFVCPAHGIADGSAPYLYTDPD